MPPETPDFNAGGQFMPLTVAMSPYGQMIFTVAARPAFGDGAVAQWLDYICNQEGYLRPPISEIRIGEIRRLENAAG